MVRFTDVAAEREAVFAGHHDIEDDEIDAVFLDRLARGFGAIDGSGAPAVLFQKLGQRLADLAMVVNDEDMGVFRRHSA